jgi:SAM-dependent methyltransferase
VSSASSDGPPTDRATLRRQYRDGSTLDARSSIYQWQEPRHDLVGSVVSQLRPGDRPVVDVGCGRGQYLAGVRSAGFPAVGLDLSLGMGPDLVGDAARLPFPDRCAGAALALHMLYHLPDPADGLRELDRITRPDGTIVVLTNGLDHLQPYRELLSEAGGVDDILAWPGRSFALEHRDLVESVLGPVELVDLSGRVTLDHVEPLVAYAASSREFYERASDRPWPEVLARFAELARARLARDGAIVLPTRSGLFVRHHV